MEQKRIRAIQAAARHAYEQMRRERISAPENLWVPPSWDELDRTDQTRRRLRFQKHIEAYERVMNED
jgi:hypothetical protein